VPHQVLFGLFTLAMFTEQISSILSDQTGAERRKNHQLLSLTTDPEPGPGPDPDSDPGPDPDSDHP